MLISSDEEEEQRVLPSKLYLQRADFLEKMSDDELYGIFRFDGEGIKVFNI